MTRDARVSALAMRLRIWCENFGHEIDAAGRISEAVAADILGKSPITLRNWRSGHRPLPFYQGRPVTYAIEDLARFIEERRSEDPVTARIELAASGK